MVISVQQIMYSHTITVHNGNTHNGGQQHTSFSISCIKKALSVINIKATKYCININSLKKISTIVRASVTIKNVSALSTKCFLYYYYYYYDN